MAKRTRSDKEPRRRLPASADGWRGVIGETFDAATAAEIAYQVVTIIGAQGSANQVLVGYDSRRGGRQVARAVADAAYRAGARAVTVVPHLPTPTATNAIRSSNFDLCLLVTASHNPACWNGIKVKVAPGCSPDDGLEREVAAAPLVKWGQSQDSGTSDSGDRSELLDSHIRSVLAGSRRSRRPTTPLQVVVDGLHGIAGQPTAQLCHRLGWRTLALGGHPRSDFGGMVPDPSLPESRARALREVLSVQADLGVVVDGDGDRLYVLDHYGETVLPHELFALLLRHRGPALPGERVAVTVSTGVIAVRVARELGYEVVERPVGFKHMSGLFAARAVTAACGGVGDMAFAEHGFDRDPFAVLAALADLLADAEAPLHDLVTGLRSAGPRMRWFEQRVPASAEHRALVETGRQALAAISHPPVRITEIDGVKFWLSDDQWVLLRNSTTEGGLRIYGEMCENDGTQGRISYLTSVVHDMVNRQEPSESY